MVCYGIVRYIGIVWYFTFLYDIMKSVEHGERYKCRNCNN